MPQVLDYVKALAEERRNTVALGNEPDRVDQIDAELARLTDRDGDEGWTIKEGAVVDVPEAVEADAEPVEVEVEKEV